MDRRRLQRLGRAAPFGPLTSSESPRAGSLTRYPGGVRTNHAAIAAILLAAAVVMGCQSCPPSNRMEKTIPVASLPDGADAAAGETTAELVSRCQASADQCRALCERAVGYGYGYTIASWSA